MVCKKKRQKDKIGLTGPGGGSKSKALHQKNKVLIGFAGKIKVLKKSYRGRGPDIKKVDFPDYFKWEDRDNRAFVGVPCPGIAEQFNP
ncbi:MAG: hypothetical protein ACXVMS_02375 [Flavisolibacter sp.]